MFVTRRHALALIGLATTAVLLPAARAQTRKVPACTVRPAQTEGPFFVDGKLERSDIRPDPARRTVKPGTPLRLAFNVATVSANGCVPLPGAQVHLWQCDAAGAYSGVRDGIADTRGQQFLRGFQVTDADGVARFLTVYPGWYPGRAAHVHFKVRHASAPGRAQEFTSQIYFDDAVTDAVHALSPYAARGKRDTRNADDYLYMRGGGRQLTVALAQEGASYAGTFDIGLSAGGAS
ncbi:MAG: intradiol ring-cleavage dioxygenase [Burkholderiales bacterium]